MGVLKTLTNEYFGDTIREEDKIPIGDLEVEIVSFTDNNGKLHKNGYRVKDGDPNEMAKTLKTLIERIIEERGPECSLNDIDVSNIKKMCYEDEGFVYGVFYASPFNGDVSGWDVSNVESMKHMFVGTKSFNQPLDKWDVSNVRNMSGMFHSATSFNQPLDNWNVSSVENMSGMFYNAKSFNQPLDKWEVSSVENMYQMFWNAKSFNQDISGWDVSNVRNMFGMFHRAESFNQPLDKWGDKLLNVKNMNLMFDNTPLENNNKLPKWYR